MRKCTLYVFYILLFILFVVSDLFAYSARKDNFFKPQVGLWFGPISPVFETADLVDNNLGIGMFFRHNTPFQPLKVGYETSYQYFSSRGVNRLYFVPTYMNLLYLLPFNLPVKLQIKAGAGAAWMKIKPDNVSRWNPILNTGAEMSFPAGRFVNIGLRLDYYYIYEKYIDNAAINGHIVNAGLQLYFNISI